MLGYLLARANIDVTILEKWPDFFRDFRGDTIHPATMEILAELGILDSFLELHHNETHQLTGYVGQDQVTIADFSHLSTRCNFIAFIPQWNFLKFIVDQAQSLPSFHLLMETEAVDLLRDNSRVSGVVAKSQNQELRIDAELVIGADGRGSTLRRQADAAVEDLGAPMDVLWFRLSQKPGDPPTSLGRIDFGRMMVMLDRDDYWQCGFLICKGSFEQIRSKGLEEFRASIGRLAPFLEDRVHEISSWDEVKLLSVKVDHLTKWYQDGLLFLGDAAHAMSPIGGVGINLAIQDAMAAANILIPKFHHGRVTVSDLQAVQERREGPTRQMQSLQVFIQHNLIEKVLRDDKPIKMPWLARLLFRLPGVNRVPARIIGMGFQPEHVAPALFD